MSRTGLVWAGVCFAIVLIMASSAGASTVSMSIPDTTAGRGDTLYIPMWSTDVTDSNVYSYQFVMSYDSTFIEIVDVTDDGAITDAGPWMSPTWHIIAGQESLRVASAGTEPLSGQGLFVSVGVRVLDSAPSDSSVYLGLHQCILNEGNPAVSPDGGYIFITTVGVDRLPDEGGGPVRIERLSPTAVRWELASADTHGARLQIYDAFGRFVTSVEPAGSEDATTFTWKGRNSDGDAVSGGVYFYSLSSGEKKYSGKVCILR